MSIGIKNICKKNILKNCWKALLHMFCSIISQKSQSRLVGTELAWVLKIYNYILEGPLSCLLIPWNIYIQSNTRHKNFCYSSSPPEQLLNKINLNNNISLKSKCWVIILSTLVITFLFKSRYKAHAMQKNL